MFTFVVVAADSEALKQLMSVIPKEKIDEVKKYINRSMSKSDEEREDKDSERVVYLQDFIA